MKCTAYVDGSFMQDGSRSAYGSGIYLTAENLQVPVEMSFGGDSELLLKHRNVAGEIQAVVSLLELLKQLPEYDEVDLFYDYHGIEAWVTGEWRAQKDVSIFYRDTVREHLKRIKINFHHVIAHSGDYGNTMADELAKKGCKDFLAGGC